MKDRGTCRGASKSAAPILATSYQYACASGKVRRPRDRCVSGAKVLPGSPGRGQGTSWARPHTGYRLVSRYSGENSEGPADRPGRRVRGISRRNRALRDPGGADIIGRPVRCKCSCPEAALARSSRRSDHSPTRWLLTRPEREAGAAAGVELVTADSSGLRP